MEHFYYSEKQDQEHKKLFDEGKIDSYQECYAYIDGKVVLYSEQQQPNVGSNWDDAVYLGQGHYHHAENLRCNPAFENMDLTTHMELNLEACRRMLNLSEEGEPLKEEWAEVIGD
jgi:hypothetical protein